MKVAICEDEAYFLKYASSVIGNCFLEYGIKADISCYQSSSKLREDLIKQKEFDVVFLDIDMPEIDGIRLGRFLRRRGGTELLIYLSSKSELVFESFEARPFSFLPKEQFEKKIKGTLRAALTELKDAGEWVQLTIGGVRYRWNLRKLMYIECSNKTLFLHFKDEVRSVTYQIGALEQELVPHGFIRVHKGYLVNYRFIFCIEAEGVQLDNQEVIPLSKHRAAQVKTEFLRWTT